MKNNRFMIHDLRFKNIFLLPFFLILIIFLIAYCLLPITKTANAQYQFCGDGSCTGSESCAGCWEDCGFCGSSNPAPSGASTPPINDCGSGTCPNGWPYTISCYPTCGSNSVCSREPADCQACHCSVCGCEAPVCNEIGWTGTAFCQADGSCTSNCGPEPGEPVPIPSPACVADAPVGPTLSSPADGAAISTTNLTLSWTHDIATGATCYSCPSHTNNLLANGNFDSPYASLGWSDPAWADTQVSLIPDGCCGNYIRETTKIAAGGTITGYIRKSQWINANASTTYTLNACGRRTGNATSFVTAEEYSAANTWLNGHSLYFTSSNWTCQQVSFVTAANNAKLAVSMFLGTIGGTTPEPATDFDADNIMILAGNVNPIPPYTPNLWGVYNCGPGCCPNSQAWGTQCAAGTSNAGVTCQKTYKIYLSNNLANLWTTTPIVNLGGASEPALSYNLTTLTGGTYYWAVCALNANVSSGVTPACSEIRSFTVQNVPPAAPTNVSPANGADLTNNTFSYQWNHSGSWGTYVAGNNQHFYVFTRTASGSYNLAAPDCDYSCVGCTSPGGAYDTCSKTITWGQSYFWKVRASNAGTTGVADSLCLTNNTCADSAETSYTATHGPWFQVIGGNIYAGSTVSTQIPQDTCSGTCKPYLMVNDPVSLYHGIVSYGTSLNLGTFCTGGCIPNYVAEGTNDWRVNHAYGGVTYNYDWWVSHLIDETKTAFTGGTISSLASGIYEMSGTTLSGSVGTNKVIILKSGDITVDGAVNVEPGGFLMVVASGTITFSNTLGGTAAHGDLQGIFIANSLNFGAGSTHLYAEGTFIGWSTLDMGTRTLTNNTMEPVMTFKLRPDFIINAPDSVKKVYYPKWQQEPG